MVILCDADEWMRESGEHGAFECGGVVAMLYIAALW